MSVQLLIIIQTDQRWLGKGNKSKVIATEQSVKCIPVDTALQAQLTSLDLKSSDTENLFFS